MTGRAEERSPANAPPLASPALRESVEAERAGWEGDELAAFLERRRARIAEARVLKIAQELAAEAVARPRSDAAGRLLAEVTRRELPPHACARRLLAEATTAHGGDRDG